jgi:hypothetical protein
MDDVSAHHAGTMDPVNNLKSEPGNMNTHQPSRRTFVKQSALAAAAIGTAPAVLRGQNARRKIRMGFIGVGNRGIAD